MHLVSTFTTISIDLASAVFILYSFTLLGHSIRSRFPALEWTPPVAVLWEAYLGLTVAAIALTLFGMAGFFSQPVLIALLAAGPLMNCRNPGALLAPWRSVHDVVRSLKRERWAGLALAVPAAIVLTWAAVPEIFYDALYYHLGLPQQYLLKGKIEWDSAVVHSAFPAYLDVLFGLCLGIASSGAAKFFNMLLFVLACAATAAFLSYVIGDLRATLIGTVTLATVPGVLVMSTMCAIDSALIGFSAMSALAVARARYAITASTGGLVGIVCFGAGAAGFVAGSKYTGLWLIATLAPALLIPRHWRQTLRASLLFTVLALAIAAPWYVRNAVLTGDPLYPTISGLLGNADALWAVQRLQRDVPTIGLTWTAPAALVSAMMHRPGTLGAGAETGILLPVGAMALLIGAIRLRELRPWALTLTFYLAIWLSFTGVMRYLYPVFPLCALGIAASIRPLFDRGPRSGLALALVVSLALAPLSQSILLLNSLYVGSDVAALFSGSLSRDEYLSRRLAYYPAAQWLNAHTGSAARVLYLGETRLLYLDREVTLASAYDAGHFDRLLAPDAPPLWTSLKRLGVTHVLINGREINRLRAAYDYLPLDAEAEHRLKTSLQGCRVVFRQSGVQLCEVPQQVS